MSTVSCIDFAELFETLPETPEPRASEPQNTGFHWPKRRSGSRQAYYFAPIHWPKRRSGSRQAYYRLSEFGVGNEHWLSSLLGLNETQTCFEVYIDGRLGGPKVNVKERVQDFYAKTPALHEFGFVCTDGELRLPFTFDAAKLAEEYPDLRKQMLMFEKIFDKLLKANEHIEKLILGMVPPSAAK